jgi:transposase-like protein
MQSDLEKLLREGARQMLEVALQVEVAEYVKEYQEERDEQDRRQVVRNGSHPPRQLVTGVGKVPVRQPRVDDRREGEKFTSAILPRYARRAPSIDALIPALYLKGISTSSFPEALKAILGDNVSGLSAANIVRLKQVWEKEYDSWRRRDLSGKRYAYVWVDGIYFNVRLQPERPCVLVVIGATKDGTKELLAVMDGERESYLSWLQLLQDLKARGLTEDPCIAVGDRSLGFWKALREVFPRTREQQCWVHKTANVLDAMPKCLHVDAKRMIHDMYMAPTKEEALKAYQLFLDLYEAKYSKACECLRKDEDVLFTFYDFPAEHWVHLRTTNPIESTFATVRHRTRQTKGCGSRMATLTMVFKLATDAEKHWRRLKGAKLITQVVEGVQFIDGEMKKAA